MPCVKSTAQSTERRTVPDSTAVAQDFIRNANALLDSLTALHFARQRITSLEKELAKTTSERDQVTAQYQRVQANSVGQQIQSTVNQIDLRSTRSARHWSRIENWVWRIGAGFFIYKKLCPSCPP